MDKNFARKRRKQWLRAADNKKRMLVIGAFMDDVLTILVNPKTPQNGLIKIYEASKKFCDKPISKQEDPEIQWYLDENWFLQFLVQSLSTHDPVPVKKLFQVMGWNYDNALNPRSSDRTTTEMFGVKEVMDGSIGEVKLLLVSRSAIPIGTTVRNIRSGKTYDIVGHDKNRYEMVGHHITLYRYEDDIRRSFEIIG